MDCSITLIFIIQLVIRLSSYFFSCALSKWSLDQKFIVARTRRYKASLLTLSTIFVHLDSFTIASQGKLRSAYLKLGCNRYKFRVVSDSVLHIVICMSSWRYYYLVGDCLKIWGWVVNISWYETFVACSFCFMWEVHHGYFLYACGCKLWLRYHLSNDP